MLDGLTLALWGQTIAQLYGASAATTLIDYHATLQGAHTVTTLIDAVALLHQTWSTIFVDVEGATRWTDALSIHVANEALFDDAERTLIALHRRITGVSL